VLTKLAGFCKNKYLAVPSFKSLSGVGKRCCIDRQILFRYEANGNIRFPAPVMLSTKVFTRF